MALRFFTFVTAPVLAADTADVLAADTAVVLREGLVEAVGALGLRKAMGEANGEEGAELASATGEEGRIGELLSWPNCCSGSFPMSAAK